MAFSMSGVEDGYSYSRFDLYEKKSKDCECESEKDCDCDDKKAKGRSYVGKDEDEDEGGAEGAMSEGLDPVGKEDGDVDNDGDKDSSDKYLMKRRKAIGKAMKKEDSEESYTAAYMEGYKELPKAKMQDKAAMKPDTARGEKQARKMDVVRKATEMAPDEVKGAVKGREMDNKKTGLERRFNAPSADGASEKDRKNKAYKLEGQRRRDLDKRYGPKKEELEGYGMFSEAEIDNIIEQMFYSEEDSLGKSDTLGEGNFPKDAPSIKDAKPAKKTDVKMYKGLGYAPVINKEELSIDDQMRISREAAKGRNPKPDHKAIRAKMLKKPLPKDNRTDAQKMTDAVGKPRMGSSD